MSLDDALRAASVVTWSILIVCLVPAIWRLLRARGRYFDPVWGIVFLLAINRLSFLARIPLELSHATAALLALTMAGMTIGYRHHDR
jgi:hypothetical protein